MSKEAAQRAMREARFRDRSAAPAASTAARPAQAKAKAPGTTAPASSTGALCGHRSMNGRTCTREHGHAAKSHRYS